MKFGNLTYVELRALAAADTLVVIPTGCTEQQGPHLPVDFDSWFAETMALAAAAYARTELGVPVLVLPATPFGPTPEHRNFGAGYIDIPVALHHAWYEAVLRSLAEQGFRKLALWRGCGGHALDQVAARFNADQRGRAQVSIPAWPYHATWCRIGDPSVPGGHADSFTTSLALYLRPDSVRLDQIHDPKNRPVDWEDPALDFARYSESGVIGDPTYAGAALGRQLWESLIPQVAQILADIAADSV